MTKVVKGGQTNRLLSLSIRGLDDKGFHRRVLPASQVVAAGGREGDLDRESPIPGSELRVSVPFIDLLDVLRVRRP
jgi:hypothetical protein